MWFTAHPEGHELFPSNQSAYRRHHNTETAVVSVMNDIICVIEHSEVTALVLLDSSAAFDTVDHSKLLDVFHRRFAVSICGGKSTIVLVPMVPLTSDAVILC